MSADEKIEPPRWAEQFLRMLLKPRDRDTIAGDLMEEYKLVVLPARGRVRAGLWYVKQVLSLVDGFTLGLVLGVAFGAWNLIGTMLDPLAEDTPAALVAFYGPMLMTWGLAGFAAARRSGRMRDAAKTGAIVAGMTFAAFSLANILRINLFLESIVHRTDWQNMVVGFHASGFDTMRAFANYIYITGFPIGVAVGTMIGATAGLVGGLAAIVRNEVASRLT